MQKQSALVTKKSQKRTNPKVTKCILCGYRHCNPTHGLIDSPKSIVYKCPNCQLQFVSPPKARGEAGISLSPEEQFSLMRPLMADRLKFFEENVPAGGTILEIGCESGYFLDALQEN